MALGLRMVVQRGLKRIIRSTIGSFKTTEGGIGEGMDVEGFFVVIDGKLLKHISFILGQLKNFTLLLGD